MFAVKEIPVPDPDSEPSDVQDMHVFWDKLECNIVNTGLTTSGTLIHFILMHNMLCIPI